MEELRPVLKPKKSIGFYLNSGWYFDSPVEKLILVGLGILGLWKLINLFGFL